MSENIIIQEGGTNFQFSADMIRTDQVGGGNVNWVPESEIGLTTKNVTRNGTYIAARDGYYGYSKFTVNVTGGSVTGKGSDGKEHHYTTDGSGNIVDTIVPVAIGITVPASVLTYADRANIVFDGTVVALNADGTAWNATGYPNGIIPNEELTMSDTIADINKVIHPDDDYSNGAFYVSSGGLFTVNYQDDDGDNYIIVPPLVKIVSMYNGSGSHYVVCISNDPFEFVCQKYSNGSVVVESKITAGQYTYNGQTYYYTSNRWYLPEPVVSIVSNSYTNPVPDAFAAAIGGRAVGEEGQPITLSWARPGDGKILQTTYYISVVDIIPGGHGED